MVSHSEESYERSLSVVVPYFCLHLFSFLSLSSLLATFAFCRLHRDSTILGLLVIFPVSNWSTSILALSGHLTTAQSPPFGICLANAVLVLGGSSALSAAALAVALRIFLVVLTGSGWSTRWASRWPVTIALLALPYVAWLAVVLSGLVRGLRRRDIVHRAAFYCVVEDDALDTVSAILPVVLLALTIVLQGTTAVILVRHWVQLRRLTRRSETLPGPPHAFSTTAKAMRARFRTLNFALALRVLLFLGCVIVALVIAVISMDDWTSVVGDFAISSIGPLVFVIFASQRDVLQAWHILPRDMASSSSETSPTSDVRMSSRRFGRAHDADDADSVAVLPNELPLSTLDRLQVPSAGVSPSSSVDTSLDDDENKSTDHLHVEDGRSGRTRGRSAPAPSFR